MTGLDPRYRVGSFVIVNLDLVDALGSWEAAGVLQRVEWRCQATGSWTASLEDVATEVRLSEHRTRSALKALVERGYLARERSAPYDPTPVWTVILTTDGPTPEDPERPRDGESKNSTHVSAESGDTCGANLPSPPIDKGDNYPPTPTDGGETLWADDTPRADRTDPLRGFEAWYALYPKKVGKGRARKNWATALRQGADPDLILAGLQRQRQHLDDQKERGYCPDPGTWLGAERWDDEAPVVALRRDRVPLPGESYDPDHEATLPPPPRRDLFG